MNLDLPLHPQTEAASPRPPRIRRRSHWRNYATSYLFLVPSGLGFVLFMLVPLVFSFVMAFTDWQMLRPEVRFVGFGNFLQLLGFHRGPDGIVANDPQFWHYLYNTVFLMLGIPLMMAGSLGLALLVNQNIRGVVLFRVLFYLPMICNGIAIYMVWRLLYDGDNGLINAILRMVGINGPEWLGSTTWAKPALVIMFIWIQAGGNNMIIYLAALQNMPQELYEAAELDGAGAWQRFRHVTWPLLLPATFFIFTMSIIAGFQGGFNAAYIMTQGGPAGSTTTISYYIYNTAYTGQLLMGYGCAIAWVLFFFVFTVTLVNFRYGKESALQA